MRVEPFNRVSDVTFVRDEDHDTLSSFTMFLLSWCVSKGPTSLGPDKGVTLHPVDLWSFSGPYN